MKKNRLLVAAFMACVWSSCSQDESFISMSEKCSVFTGNVEMVESRTSLGTGNNILWVVGDKVSIFTNGNNINREYRVANVGGGTAEFKYTGNLVRPNPVEQGLTGNYAVYPYSGKNTLAVSSGTLSVPVEAGYDFKDRESFISSALMAAKNEEAQMNFNFKNVQGYLRMRLRAEIPEDYAPVKSVTFTSNSKNLSGTAEITWANGIPSATIVSNQGKSLTVTMDANFNSVLPSKESGEYLEFYVPVLPMEFGANDVTMVVTFTDNSTYTKVFGNPFSIARREVTGLKHTIGVDDFTGDIETVVVNSNEEFAALNGQSGEAWLNGDLSSETPISFDGSLWVEGDLTLDMKGNELKSGSASGAYAFKINGNGANVTINNTNVNSLGGGFQVVNGSHLTFNEGSVAVNSTYTKGARYNFYVVGQGSVLTINGGEFSFTGAKRAYIYAGAGATVYVNGGKFGKASTNSDYKAGIKSDGTGTVIISGGTFGFDPTQWLATGYTTITKDGNWYVVPEGAEEIAKDNAELQNALAAGKDVYLAAGEYTMPAAKNIASGTIIYCGEGTVFTGKTSADINGATVVGATFSNPNDDVLTGTLNGTFKNCTFEGNNALRWCYAKAGKSAIFEGCTFKPSGVYAIHFDTTTGADIKFKNCKIIGWAAIGSGHNSLVFDGCEVYGDGTYGVIRTFGNATIKNCTFDVDNVNKTDAYQDGIHAVDCVITVENCVNVNGQIEDIFNVSGTGKIQVQ